MERIVLGGGCFWCLEAVFQRVKGVSKVTPGYSGGEIKNPTYEEVSGGNTGHIEVVEVLFDPNVITLESILEVFFEIHDPTTIDRQGNDVGFQYNSRIYYINDTQRETSLQTIEKLNSSHKFPDKIVTKVEALKEFYQAEDYHLDYYNRNKNQPYCKIVIEPKVRKLLNRTTV
jgi:peptide-methionine (S)-S-oxide reductase